MRTASALISAMLLFSIASAWSWNDYSGTSHWDVAVTEDDSGCGGGTWTDEYSMLMEHNGASAVFEDPHGTIGGTFISGNILHIAGRTVDDPPGSSDISDYDVYFTADCSSFAAEYDWDYSGPEGGCSGSTQLAGTNPDGCPEVVEPMREPEVSSENQLARVRVDLMHDFDLRGNIAFLKLQSLLLGEDKTAEIAEIQRNINLLEGSIEAKYRAILDQDPNNFEANWDMAQLKRGQGLPHEYYEYMDRALNSGSVTQGTRDLLEQQMARDLGFSTFPKPQNSLLMRQVGGEVDNWQGTVYGENPGTEASGSNWYIKLFGQLASPGSLVTAAVFE